MSWLNANSHGLREQKKQGHMREFLSNYDQRVNRVDRDPSHLAREVITEEIKSKHMINR